MCEVDCGYYIKNEAIVLHLLTFLKCRADALLINENGILSCIDIYAFPLF